MDTVLDLLTRPFFLRALVVGLFVSVCAALLGVSLVLKRYAMIGDGLSHVSFAAVAIGAVVGGTLGADLNPMLVALPIVLLAAVFLLRIRESSRLQGDSVIAIISTAALALGSLLIYKSELSTELGSYLFGSLFAISEMDLYISIPLSLAVLLLFVLFYNDIFRITFDEGFARATGTRTGLYNLLIACLTAVTVVLGMQMMGSLLISALIVFPALTAMRLFRNFRQVVITAAVLSVCCFLSGVLLSFFFDLPAGAGIVLVHLVAFLGFSLTAALRAAHK